MNKNTLMLLNEEPAYYYINKTSNNDGIKYYKDAIVDELRKLGLLQELFR